MWLILLYVQYDCILPLSLVYAYAQNTIWTMVSVHQNNQDLNPHHWYVILHANYIVYRLTPYCFFTAHFLCVRKTRGQESDYLGANIFWKLLSACNVIYSFIFNLVYILHFFENSVTSGWWSHYQNSNFTIDICDHHLFSWLFETAASLLTIKLLIDSMAANSSKVNFIQS